MVRMSVSPVRPGPLNRGALADVVPAAGSYGVPTVVRVESAARIRTGRVLDNGAAGSMLPRLDAVDEVAGAGRARGPSANQ